MLLIYIRQDVSVAILFCSIILSLYIFNFFSVANGESKIVETLRRQIATLRIENERLRNEKVNYLNMCMVHGYILH